MVHEGKKVGGTAGAIADDDGNGVATREEFKDGPEGLVAPLDQDPDHGHSGFVVT